MKILGIEASINLRTLEKYICYEKQRLSTPIYWLLISDFPQNRSAMKCIAVLTIDKFHSLVLREKKEQIKNEIKTKHKAFHHIEKENLINLIFPFNMISSFGNQNFCKDKAFQIAFFRNPTRKILLGYITNIFINWTLTCDMCVVPRSAQRGLVQLTVSYCTYDVSAGLPLKLFHVKLRYWEESERNCMRTTQW